MLELKNINADFGSFSLNEIMLNVRNASWHTILGPSGAGKTLLLEVIAGLTRPKTGKLLLDGIDITKMDTARRPIAIVFQDQALFPHLNTYDNIAYPLKRNHLSKKERHETIIALAEKMNLSGLLHRFPERLSGGEQQRVALARTLAANPDIILLDEPLSSLDIHLRTELRRELRKIHKEGKTIIHVTHDPEEALALADDISVMNEGKIIQSGSTDEIMQKPANGFIANFIGIKNFFPASLSTVDTEDNICKAVLKSGVIIRIPAIPKALNNRCFLAIEPDSISLSNENISSSAQNNIKGKIVSLEKRPRGLVMLQIRAGEVFSSEITSASVNKLGLEEDSEVWMSFKASAVKVYI